MQNLTQYRVLAAVKNYGVNSFPNLASSKTSQIMFPKYLMENSEIKIKTEKKHKNKQRQCSFIRNQERKALE